MTESIRTLADVKAEIFAGTEQLFNAFLESIREQQAFTPEQNAMLSDYLHGIASKRDDLARFIESLGMMADAKRKKVRAIEKQARELEYLVSLFENAIIAQLQNWKDGAIVRRVDGEESSFRLCKNPDRLEITDLEAIPKKFRKYSWTPDKEAIKLELAAGRKVRGVQLVEDNFRVEIK